MSDKGSSLIQIRRELDTLGARLAVLEGRLVAAEAKLSQSERQPGEPGRPDLRDMGASAFDVAHARLLNAKAEMLERKLVDRWPSPAPPVRQVAAERLSLETDVDTNRITLFGEGAKSGERVGLAIKPESAVWLAEALLSAKRNFDERRR